MFVPWLASSEVLGDRESDPERRDVRREPAFSKAFVCKVSGSLFAPTQALWLDRAPLAHGRIVHQEVGASYGGRRQFPCGATQVSGCPSPPALWPKRVCSVGSDPLQVRGLWSASSVLV